MKTMALALGHFRVIQFTFAPTGVSEMTFQLRRHRTLWQHTHYDLRMPFLFDVATGWLERSMCCPVGCVGEKDIRRKSLKDSVATTELIGNWKTNGRTTEPDRPSRCQHFLKRKSIFIQFHSFPSSEMISVFYDDDDMISESAFVVGEKVSPRLRWRRSQKQTTQTKWESDKTKHK